MVKLKNKIDLKGIDIKKRFKLDLKKQLGITGIFCIIALIVCYFLSTSYHTSKSSSSIIQTVFLKNSYKSKYQLLTNLKLASKETDTFEKSIQAIQEELLPSTSISNVMDNISKIGRDESLNFIYFKPKKRELFKNYMILPIQISVTGEYQDMVDFLKNIADLDRVIVIHAFVLMRKGTEGNVVILNAQLDVFNPPPANQIVGVKK